MGDETMRSEQAEQAGSEPAKAPENAPEKTTEATEKTTEATEATAGTTSRKASGKDSVKDSGKAPAAEKSRRKDRGAKDPGAPGLVGVLRTRLAQVVWTAAVVCALFLAVGALLIALGANTGNALVRFVLDVADALDLQVFARRNGVFEMKGADAATKNALANWGLAAVAYLVVGRILDRVIRP